MAVIDEEKLRRSNWRDDLRVTLADGQEWSLTRPVIRTGVGSRRSCSLGSDYLTRWNAFNEAQAKIQAEPEDSPTMAKSMQDWQDSRLMLIVESLRSNYDLTEDQALDLVMFDMQDDHESSVFNRAFATAYGAVPKTSATGSSAG